MIPNCETLLEARARGHVKFIRVYLEVEPRPYRTRLHPDFEGIMRATETPISVLDEEFPTVWAERTEPGPLDLRWVKGADLFLHGGPDGAYFDRWFDALTAAEPNILVGAPDSGGLIFWPEY